MYEKFVKYYFRLINNKEFIRFGKKLAHFLDIELEKNNIEVETVKNWVRKIKGLSINSEYFKIFLDTLFIHSYNHSDNGSFPSGVEFDYYGNLGRSELADILFVNSFYLNRKLILRKINFNQVKKQKNNSRWEIDEKQLYLLTRLPRFKGVRGSIIPMQDFFITSCCGNLTSYGLINKKNFIFISANNILLAKENKKSVNLKDLKLIVDKDKFYNIRKRCYFYSCYDYLPFFYSTSFSSNTYDFIFNFIKGYIGEQIKDNVFYYENKGANNLLSGILEHIKVYGKKINNKEILNFINSFDDIDGIINNDRIVDESGKWFAIVHIKIYLGE